MNIGERVLFHTKDSHRLKNLCSSLIVEKTHMTIRIRILNVFYGDDFVIGDLVTSSEEYILSERTAIKVVFENL